MRLRGCGTEGGLDRPAVAGTCSDGARGRWRRRSYRRAEDGGRAEDAVGVGGGNILRRWAAAAGAGDVWVGGGIAVVVRRGVHIHPTGLWLVVGTAAAALAATLIGIPAATIVARESGREDPGFVVIDEVAGQWIALIGVRPEWRHALLALVLFRLFDIWKPWPIHRLEELPEGTGIMLDDVAAGLLALAVGLLAAGWMV